MIKNDYTILSSTTDYDNLLLDFFNPSIVVIFFPCNFESVNTQALVAFPSTITVQAPQAPSEQPSLVPVR